MAGRCSSSETVLSGVSTSVSRCRRSWPPFRCRSCPIRCRRGWNAAATLNSGARWRQAHPPERGGLGVTMLGLSRARWQRRFLLGLALVALVGAGPLLACFAPDYDTVHFRGDRPDFFQMPQPWRGYPEEKRALSPYSDRSYERDERERHTLITRTLRLEATGQFR